MSVWSPEQRERFQAALAEKKRVLWNEVRDDLFRAQGEELATQYDIPQDPGEAGIVDLLSDTGLAVADLRVQELTRIEEALVRLDQGTYGICEDCGEPIPEERLHVDPHVPCCVSCQEQRERVAAQPHATL